MDYGPQGSADVTENLLDSVPCGPVLHDPAEPEQDTQSLPYLYLRAPFHPVDSPAVQEVAPFFHSAATSACCFSFSSPQGRNSCAKGYSACSSHILLKHAVSLYRAAAPAEPLRAATCINSAVG